MMEISMLIKQTANLSEEDKKILIGLKQQYWPYNYEMQIRWFDNNIQPNDYHILMKSGGMPCAYLNVANVEVEFDSSKHSMLGIGNVCVDKSFTKLGYGSVLMSCVNMFIKSMNSCGILLCKEKLLDFYSSSNWKRVYSKDILVEGESFNDYTMIYDPYNIIYSTSINSMIINRNF